MYKFNWDGFTEDDYKVLKDNITNMYDEYCGNVRVGTLCFDLVVRDNELQYDLYIYGTTPGYAYAMDGTPYDCWDGGGLPIGSSYEGFKQIAETEFIKDIESLNCIEEAEKPLKLWQGGLLTRPGEDV